MNLDKLLQNIRLGWSPLAVIAGTTLAAIAISIYCLSSGQVIIFQNLFYIPIIIACMYYTQRAGLKKLDSDISGKSALY
jgi:hypothetical protein